MLNVSMVRAKCYLILQGLERSLAENLVNNYDINSPGFLHTAEQDRALSRLRDDMGEAEWGLEDVRTDDLIEYLDLGDLIGLLNRHKANVRNTVLSQVRLATSILEDNSLPAIRKRVMHPIRPLEADDLSVLVSIAKDLQSRVPDLVWRPLVEGFRLAENPQDFLNVSIPPFWADEPTILHNLPPAEFDDTGFIGRRTERRRLKRLLEADHRVITVVGAGGIGKTALALRVCHDIIDDPDSGFERIVWITLKTQHLTADGIRQISNAVDSVDALLDRLLSAINVSVSHDEEPDWNRVIEQMKANRILLVIDNLETLGSEIRELAIRIPRDSTLLLTSRVGLGEIELRYEMPDLSTGDAVNLLRNLGLAYNYSGIVGLDDARLTTYSRRLHYNPLLIKWFVQAIGRGARAESIFAGEDLGKALRFCWENVYHRLSPLSRDVISTVLAARRALSQTQLQGILDSDHIPFVKALQELHQSNILEKSVERDGGSVYQIGSLVLDYLSQHHPPNDRVVKSTRQKLRQWQTEQDRSAVQQNTYRYNRKLIAIGSNDERIAAPHLHNALNMMRGHDFAAAHRSLERARQLTPQWWEIHRVRAHVMEMERRPIYETERAFEDSIGCRDTDVNRFHYAVYLMRIEEYERALEQIEHASAHDMADNIALRSIRGLVLLRGGHIPEALTELEAVWIHTDSDIPRHIRRVHGTQFVGALRRRLEQLYSLEDTEEAEKTALKGIQVADQAAAAYLWDWKLAEEAVKLLSEIIGRSGISETLEFECVSMASAWDSDPGFREGCMSRRNIRLSFEHNAGLGHAMPMTSTAFLSLVRPQRYEGTIARLVSSYGFISTDSLGDVHMDRSSLVRPSVWPDLRVGQRVAYQIRYKDKGPHAVELELDA